MSATDQTLIALLADAIADKVAERVAAKLQQPAGEPLAYSIAEAAKRLNLSASTLKNMIRDRELPVVRRGTRVLITRQAIASFLEANEA